MVGSCYIDGRARKIREEWEGHRRFIKGTTTGIFVRSGNTEDPGKEWSKWFGP